MRAMTDLPKQKWRFLGLRKNRQYIAFGGLGNARRQQRFAENLLRAINIRRGIGYH
jgi:hypothetical protein